MKLETNNGDPAVSHPHPERWTDQLWRAACVLLAAAVALHIGWNLMEPLMGVLIIFVVVMLVVRVAWSFRRRDEW